MYGPRRRQEWSSDGKTSFEFDTFWRTNWKIPGPSTFYVTLNGVRTYAGNYGPRGNRVGYGKLIFAGKNGPIRNYFNEFYATNNFPFVGRATPFYNYFSFVPFRNITSRINSDVIEYILTFPKIEKIKIRTHPRHFECYEQISDRYLVSRNEIPTYYYLLPRARI